MGRRENFIYIETDTLGGLLLPRSRSTIARNKRASAIVKSDMLSESRGWRAAALAAVLCGVLSNPIVWRNLERLVRTPGYDDSALVTIDRDTVHFTGYGDVPPAVITLWRTSTKFEKMLTLDRWTFADGAKAERVSPGVIELTGVRPWRGRLLRAEDSQAAVISYDFAGGDESLVGREVRLGFYKYRVVGIMPPRFRVLSRETQAWIALPRFPDHLEMVGKLRAGVSLAEAQDDLRRISLAGRQGRARKLEVITLRHNRQDDLMFVISVLKWNFGFVCLMSLGALARFLFQRKRNITLGQQTRYLGFLIAKTAVIFTALGVFWIVLVDPSVQKFLSGMAGWSMPVLFWCFLLGSWGLTFWSLRDQQHRCRVCCQILRMPVDSGQWSSLVIDRPRTEYICAFGHGTLYVPGTRLLDLDSVNWTSHQDMWSELFSELPAR